MSAPPPTFSYLRIRNRMRTSFLLLLTAAATALLASCSSENSKTPETLESQYQARKDSVKEKVMLTSLTGDWKGVVFSETDKGWQEDSVYIKFLRDGQFVLGLPGLPPFSSNNKQATTYEYDSTQQPNHLDMVFRPRTPEAAREMEEQFGLTGDIRAPGIVRFLNPDEILWANDLQGDRANPVRPKDFKDKAKLMHAWRVRSGEIKLEWRPDTSQPSPAEPAAGPKKK